MSLDNFAMEWRIHTKTQFDSTTGRKYAELSLATRTGFDLVSFKGQTILEAGCGAGRYLEVVHSKEGNAVGLDGSKSVFAARKNLTSEVDLVQADLFHPPFKSAVFDKVFSLGVLHHTPDPQGGLLSLAPLLVPRGQLAVSLYSNEGLARRYANAVGGIARALASSVGLTTLYRVCQRLAGIPIPRVLLSSPYMRPSDVRLSPTLALNLLLPFLSTVEDKDWRTLDTFDYLSAKYQSKHAYAEVIGWFKKAGLTDVRRLEVPVSVSGSRPVAP